MYNIIYSIYTNLTLHPNLFLRCKRDSWYPKFHELWELIYTYHLRNQEGQWCHQARFWIRYGLQKSQYWNQTITLGDEWQSYAQMRASFLQPSVYLFPETASDCWEGWKANKDLCILNIKTKLSSRSSFMKGSPLMICWPKYIV